MTKNIRETVKIKVKQTRIKEYELGIIEVLPCPFCNSRVEDFEVRDEEHACRVFCRSCGALRVSFPYFRDLLQRKKKKKSPHQRLMKIMYLKNTVIR